MFANSSYKNKFADVSYLTNEQRQTLLKLYKHGLTSAHIHSCYSWDESQHRLAGGFYRQAFISLMTDRGVNNKTAEQAVIELNGLNYIEAAGISKGLDRADVLGLSLYKIDTFLRLREHGLTSDHLRQFTDEGSQGYSYCDALINLMTERDANNKNTADQAVLELSGLDHLQAWGISKGLNRADVLGLDWQKIDALLKLRERGLTSERLRLCNWSQVEDYRAAGTDYCDALSHLIYKRGDDNRTLDQALKEVDSLSNYSQIQGISKGLNRAQVIGLSGKQIDILLALHEYGLTAEHIRKNPKTCKVYYFNDAFIHLRTKRGINNKTADEAAVELHELDDMQVKGISRGLNRVDVLGLDENKIDAYFSLRNRGLTIEHLRSCNWSSDPDPYYGTRRYADALIYLMRECGVAVEKALEEINGLNSWEVYGIAGGLNRKDVIGLDIVKIDALLKFHTQGLTCEHLRQCHWQQTPDYVLNGYSYSWALKQLMKERGVNNKTLDQALEELEGLDCNQAKGIFRGLNRSDVLGLTDKQITALLELQQYGLTSNHLRQGMFLNSKFGLFTLKNMMKRQKDNKTVNGIVDDFIKMQARW